MIHVLHLTASPFFGGPERVILDIVRTRSVSPFPIESTIATFDENGGCEPFLAEIAKRGLNGVRLVRDMPHLIAAARELTRMIKERRIDLVCAHGHKSRALGWFAARRVGIPIIGVSHGWTWQDFRTSLYERFDQWMHRRMDAVVAVSQGQAEKIVRSGTPRNRVHVIHNAIDPVRFENGSDPTRRQALESLFDGLSNLPTILIGAAGRLSPEKGYDVLIDAFARIAVECPRAAVVLFGEGASRENLQRRIDAHGIQTRFLMPGFTPELDRLLPGFDIFAQSSRTEGFPCVNLEAMSAGVPVVATAVGGVPEQIVPETTGLLVPPGDPQALAASLKRLIGDADLRRSLAGAARKDVRNRFTCDVQAGHYVELFERVLAEHRKPAS